MKELWSVEIREGMSPNPILALLSYLWSFSALVVGFIMLASESLGIDGPYGLVLGFPSHIWGVILIGIAGICIYSNATRRINLLRAGLLVLAFWGMIQGTGHVIASILVSAPLGETAWIFAVGINLIILSALWKDYKYVF